MKDTQLSIGFAIGCLAAVAVLLGVSSSIFSRESVEAGAVIFLLFFAVSFGFTGANFGPLYEGRKTPFRQRIAIGIGFAALVAVFVMWLIDSTN